MTFYEDKQFLPENVIHTVHIRKMYQHKNLQLSGTIKDHFYLVEGEINFTVSVQTHPNIPRRLVHTENTIKAQN